MHAPKKRNLEPYPSTQMPSHPVKKRLSYQSSLISLLHLSISSENVLLHGGITTSGRSRGSSVGVVCIVGTVEVVGHLRIELLRGLLGRASGATLAWHLLGTGLASSNPTLGPVGTMLHRGSRLGLNLGRSNALSKRLGLRDQLGGSDNNLNLWELLILLLSVLVMVVDWNIP
jgi:hypothetical protein